MNFVRFHALRRYISPNANGRRAFSILLILTLVVGFLANFPFDSGEDVNNARTNYLSPDRNDFWGGFAPFFYSLIPNSAFNSNIVYAVLYLILIGFGSLGVHTFLINNASNYRVLHQLIILFLTLLTSLFVLQFSRDGTLLAFVWASLGLALWSYRERMRAAWLIMAISLYVLGLSFRPWLGLISVPLVLFLIYRLKINQKLTYQRLLISTLGILALILSPILIDRTFVKITHMESAYPQQQVMIMDASALACLSANSTTVKNSLEVLTLISNRKDLNTEGLCSYFYPQSWASVVFYNKTGTAEPNPIRMILPSEQDTYVRFKEEWIKLILANPKQYVQTKLMLSSQLLLAGDSRGPQDHFLKDILSSPLNILRDLRLFSVLPFGLLLLLINRIRRNSTSIMETISVQVFYFFGVFSIAVAFIGDNQRYLIPVSLLSALLSIVQDHKFEKAA
jgi:hypothetical protein